MPDPSSGTDDPAGPGSLVCSARGCSKPAVADLRWNNVKIHPPERRKHWLACLAHEESLSAYLSARGLLREVGPASEAPAPVDR